MREERQKMKEGETAEEKKDRNKKGRSSKVRIVVTRHVETDTL